MKFFKPRVQLVRTVKTIGPDEFHLHAITMTDQANYRAAGHEIATEMDEEGMLTIVLYIEEDETPYNFSLHTPIVHTLTIGNLPFDNEDDGIIRVSVVHKGARTGQAGEGKVPVADADEDSRPGGN